MHVFTEVLEERYGWERPGVSYLSPEGKIICGGHVVNILPGGSVLDSTRAQFGEGHLREVCRQWTGVPIAEDDDEVGSVLGRAFDVSAPACGLILVGTDFQCGIWRALMDI